MMVHGSSRKLRSVSISSCQGGRATFTFLYHRSRKAITSCEGHEKKHKKDSRWHILETRDEFELNWKGYCRILLCEFCLYVVQIHIQVHADDGGNVSIGSHSLTVEPVNRLFYCQVFFVVVIIWLKAQISMLTHLVRAKKGLAKGIIRAVWFHLL